LRKCGRSNLNDRPTLRLPLGFVLVFFCVGSAYADHVADLARTLDTDRSEKARISAAVALGNLEDLRGVPALIRALIDRSAVVRALAASALGHVGDPRAIPALERALGDQSESVRARARDALLALRSGPRPPPEPVITRARITPREPPRIARARLYVVVNAMGNRGRSGPELPTRMRELVLRQLGQMPELTTSAQVGVGKLQQVVVDGSITKLSRGVNGPWTEVTCEVRITVSNARGSIMSIVSGGATVQVSTRSFRRGMESGMQVEALENAVMGAHQNLMAFLSRQVAQK